MGYCKVHNVIVEKGNSEPRLDPKDAIEEMAVPLRLNFTGEPIGTADIFLDEGVLMAHLHIEKEIHGIFYPAIGAVHLKKLPKPFRVTEVSLCAEPNQDKTIPSITIE